MSNTQITGVNISEKPLKVLPFAMGPIIIIANVLAIGGLIYSAIAFFFSLMSGNIALMVGLFVLAVVLLGVVLTLSTMLRIIEPGAALVVSFFGQYMGTVRRTGLVAIPPFMKSMKVSVKDNNFETPVSKVNDANGNPINISAIVVWRMRDTAKATYAVDNYFNFLTTQAEAAVRHVAAAHPYDAGVAPVNTDADETQLKKRVSLLDGAEEINREMFEEITERAQAAGVEIVEVRINNLAYSVEIAQAMLQRQQAAAVVDARKIIVEGALGIVEETVNSLNEHSPLTLEERSRLTSNLLVVLVGESKVTPTMDVANGR